MASQEQWSRDLQAALELLAQGQPEDSLARLRTLLRTCDNTPLCRAAILEGTARVLLALGRGKEAVSAMEESLALLRNAYGSSSPLTLNLMQNLAHLWLETGNYGKCEALGLEAVAACEAAFGGHSPRLASALLHLSAVYYRQQQWDRAEQCLQRARNIWEGHARAGKTLPDQQLGTCLNNLGRLYEERGLLAAGIDWHRQAVALRREVCGAHEDTAFSLGNLGVALASDGQWDEAARTLEEAVACYDSLGKGSSAEAESYRKNLELCRRALSEQGSQPISWQPAPERGTQHAPERATQPSLADARQALLAEIIERELVMFLATPNEGGTALCQQRPDSFRIMRRMAHEPLSNQTLASYLEDLRRAEQAGRNFMIEKYARMDNRLPPLSTSPLLDEVADAEEAFMRAASAQYPHVVVPDSRGAFKKYLRCELETLSPQTLALYAQDLRQAGHEGRNTAIERYTCLARLMGKSGLEELEASARAAAV